MPKELSQTKIELLQPRSEISPNIPGKLTPERKRLVETNDVIVTDDYLPGPSFLAKAACALNPSIGAFEALSQTGWESKHRVTVYDARSGLPNYQLAYKGDRKPTVEEVSTWDYRMTPDTDDKKTPIVGLKKTSIKVTGSNFLAVTNLSEIRTTDTPRTLHDVVHEVNLKTSKGTMKKNPEVRKIVGNVVEQLSKIPELSSLQRAKKKL